MNESHAPITQTLEGDSLRFACYIGMGRRLDSMHKGHMERNGADRDGAAKAWYYNIVGACGEAAAAIALRVPWQAGVGQSKSEPDINPDIQVRCLARSGYDLIVRPDDVDNHRYLLVTGEPPTLSLRGWVWGHEAKQEKWLRDRGGRGKPVFWVPQRSLRDPRTLVDIEASGCRRCSGDGWTPTATGFTACWMCRPDDAVISDMASRCSDIIRMYEGLGVCRD